MDEKSYLEKKDMNDGKQRYYYNNEDIDQLSYTPS